MAETVDGAEQSRLQESRKVEGVDRYLGMTRMDGETDSVPVDHIIIDSHILGKYRRAIGTLREVEVPVGMLPRTGGESPIPR